MRYPPSAAGGEAAASRDGVRLERPPHRRHLLGVARCQEDAQRRCRAALGRHGAGRRAAAPRCCARPTPAPPALRKRETDNCARMRTLRRVRPRERQGTLCGKRGSAGGRGCCNIGPESTPASKRCRPKLCPRTAGPPRGLIKLPQKSTRPSAPIWTMHKSPSISTLADSSPVFADPSQSSAAPSPTSVDPISTSSPTLAEPNRMFIQKRAQHWLTQAQSQTKPKSTQSVPQKP